MRLCINTIFVILSLINTLINVNKSLIIVKIYRWMCFLSSERIKECNNSAMIFYFIFNIVLRFAGGKFSNNSTFKVVNIKVIKIWTFLIVF